MWVALKNTGMDRDGGEVHLLTCGFGREPYTYTHIHMLTYTHTVYGPCTKSRLHSRTHKGLSDSTWVWVAYLQISGHESVSENR